VPGGQHIRPGLWLGALFAALTLSTVACGTTASNSGTGSYPTGPDIAYVSNGSGWVPFNLLRHSVSRAIPIPRIEAVTLAPGGKTAYGIGEDGIVPIDLRTGKIGAPISEVRNCESISMGGSRQTLYLAGCGDNGESFKTILPMDVKTGAAGVPITVPGHPYAVVVSPDGRTAYVLTNGGATVIPVDLPSGALGHVITIPDGVSELAISPDGTMAYANGNTGEGIGGGKELSFVTPIDLRTGVAETPIVLLHQPYGIVISPDGHTAYVTGGNYPVGAVGPPTPPDVTSINLVAGRVEATFSIPGGAGSIFNGTSGWLVE
jgi:DNA-binding beta-propeller fold protein YncE